MNGISGFSAGPEHSSQANAHVHLFASWERSMAPCRGANTSSILKNPYSEVIPLQAFGRTNMLGVVQPTFWQEYECLSNRSPWGKAHRDNLTQQGREDVGRCRTLLGWCGLCTLLSHNADESLGGFSVVCQSCMGHMCSFPETPFFFLKCFALKFFGSWCFLVSYLETPAVTPPWEPFGFSADRRIGGSKT